MAEAEPVDESATRKEVENRPSTLPHSSTNQQDDPDEEIEVVAVGSISFVLKTAFKSFYTPSPETKDCPHEEAVRSTLPDSNDDDETDEGKDGLENDDDKPQPEQPPSDADGPSSSSRPSDVPHPYQVQGQEEIQAIHERLQQQRREAKLLLDYLSTQRQASKEADEVESLRIREQGLVQKAQIPMGKSQLDISRTTTERFGPFGSNLVFARELMEQHQNKQRDASGNGPTARLQAVQVKVNKPGYLDTTSSFKLRTSKIKPRKMKMTRDTPPVVPSKRDKKHISATASGHEKDEHAKIQHRMTSKLQFLRNPRYDASSSSSPQPPLVKDLSLSTGGETRSKPQVTSPTSRGHQSICHSSTVAVDPVAASSTVVDPTKFFSLSPAQLVFENYAVGGVYEQTLYIKNVCVVSRRIRLLPPRSEFFTLGSVAFPFSNDGMIAPGMDCRVHVRFTPDTLSDFEDQFRIETEFGPVSVSLLGRRDPPILSLDSTLNVGPCLVGGELFTTFTCHNSGGSAKFWLMSEDEWTANGGLLVSKSESQSFTTGAFTVTPAEFELSGQSSVDLTITYRPKRIDSDRSSLVMVCDNCQVKTIGCVGRGVDIGLESIQLNTTLLLRRNEVQLGENNSSESGLPKLDLLRFPSVVPKDRSSQTLEMWNSTPLPLAFEWKQKACGGLEQEQVFQIMPHRGYFQPAASQSFDITFQPASVGHIETYFELVILDIPPSALPNADQSTLLENLQQQQSCETSGMTQDVVAMKMTVSGQGKALDADIQPSVIVFPHRLITGQTYSAPFQIRCKDVRETPYFDSNAIVWCRPMLLPSPHALKDFGNDTCLHASRVCDIQITTPPSPGPLQGSSSFLVTIRPQVAGDFQLQIPCTFPHGAQDTQEADLPSVLLSLEVRDEPLRIIESELDFGLVGVGSAITKTLTLWNDSQRDDLAWECTQVDAHGQINRELKRSGSNESLVSRVSSAISSAISSTSTCAEIPLRSSLSFEPSQGTLGPDERRQVTVTFTGGKCPERFRGSVECSILASQFSADPEALASSLASSSTTKEEEGSKDEKSCCSSFIAVRAEIQSPSVWLDPVDIHLGTTYINVSVSRTFKVQNLSNLPAKFKWVQPGDAVSPLFTAIFHPSRGELQAKETISVTLVYTPLSVGKINTVFACNVRGMLQPLGFQLTTIQKGVVMAYSVVDSRAPDLGGNHTRLLEPQELDGPPPAVPKIQFGDHVPIFQRSIVHLRIQNFSGIEARLSLNARKFPGVAPGARAAMTEDGPPGHYSLLSNAHELTEVFRSAQGHEYVIQKHQLREDRTILHAGAGIAISIEPSVLNISAWSQETVKITCFNDMAGRYVDHIIAQVQGLPPVRLPSSICVVGCPLQINTNCVGLIREPQQSSSSPVDQQQEADAPLTLDYGPCPYGNLENPDLLVVTKDIEIKNHGPVDARLNWFIKPFTSDEDECLVRLKILSIIPPSSHSSSDEDPPLVHVSIDYCHEGANGAQTQESMFRCRDDGQVIPKYHQAKYTVAFHIPADIMQPRAWMIANAEWLHPEDQAHPALTSQPEMLRSSSFVSVCSSDSSSDSSSSSDDEDSEDKNELATKPHNTLTKHNNPMKTSSKTLMAKAKNVVSVAAGLCLSNSSSHMSMIANPVSKSDECLRLKLRAEVVAPRLSVDMTDDSKELKFVAWSTQNPTQHPMRALTLVNRMATKLTFRVDVTSVFGLVEYQQSSSSKRTKTTTKNNKLVTTLASGEALELSLVFRVPEVSLSSARRPLRSVSKGHVRFTFLNGCVQDIGLRGEVLRPMLAIAPSDYHFGSCQLMREDRDLCLYLANPTLVCASWTLTHVPYPEPKTRAEQIAYDRELGHLRDDPHVFVFEQTQGEVRGPTLPLSTAGYRLPRDAHIRHAEAIFGDHGHHRSGSLSQEIKSSSHERNNALGTVQVKFRPTTIEHFRSRFRFQVDQGESFDIVLEGQGSVDEISIDNSDRPTAISSKYQYSDHVLSS